MYYFFGGYLPSLHGSVNMHHSPPPLQWFVNFFLVQLLSVIAGHSASQGFFLKKKTVLSSLSSGWVDINVKHHEAS